MSTPPLEMIQSQFYFYFNILYEKFKKRDDSLEKIEKSEEDYKREISELKKKFQIIKAKVVEERRLLEAAEAELKEKKFLVGFYENKEDDKKKYIWSSIRVGFLQTIVICASVFVYGYMYLKDYTNFYQFFNN